MPSLTESFGVGGIAAASAWRWWLQELSDLVPRRSSLHSRHKPRSDVRLNVSGVIIDRTAAGVGERFVNDVPLEQFDEPNWAQFAEIVEGTHIRVILAPPDVHRLRIKLPAAARMRLRSTIALQLGELSPLQPELVQWVMARPSQDKESLSVEILLVRAALLERLHNLFADRQVTSLSICGEIDDLTIQFSNAANNDSSTTIFSKLPKRTLIAAAMIASIPLTTWTGAAILTSLNASRVEALAQDVRPKIALEHQFREREQLRKALAPVIALPTISMLLDDLAGRLPSSAYLKAIERDSGGIIRFRIVARDPDAVQDALSETPLLPGLRQTGQTPSELDGVDLTYETSGS